MQQILDAREDARRNESSLRNYMQERMQEFQDRIQELQGRMDDAVAERDSALSERDTALAKQNALQKMLDSYQEKFGPLE